MYAKDSSDQESDPLSFTITAYHDASPQFHHSATYQSKQRWDTDTVIEVYEGPQVSKITDALQIPWTSTTEGARTWTLGNPDGTADSPNIKCKDQSGTTTHTWDEARQPGQRAVLNRPAGGKPAGTYIPQVHVPAGLRGPAKDHDMEQRIPGTAGQPPRHPWRRRRIPNSRLRRLGAGLEGKSQRRGATGPADRADPNLRYQ